MDELKALHHLRMSFPNKPEEYLKNMYEKYDCNINETMYQIAKSKAGTNNIFVRFFTCLIHLFCGCDFSEGSEDEYYFKSDNLRDRAEQSRKNRQMLENKARKASQSNDKSLENYYSVQAQQQSQLAEQANNMAAMAFLEENNPSKDTIDLHFLYVKEAIQALDIFLDKEISVLKSSWEKEKSLMVVTGRGKHSVDGIARVKIAVKQRLTERRLNFSELNPGFLGVFISNQSVLSTHLKKPLYCRK